MGVMAIHWTNADWTAAGTIGLFVVAAVAAVIALRQYHSAEQSRLAQVQASTAQIDEARRTAEEETRPYVLVTAEVNEQIAHMVYLVIKNYGRTAATDVRVT